MSTAKKNDDIQVKLNLFHRKSDKECVLGLIKSPDYKEFLLDICGITKIENWEGWDLHLTDKDSVIIAVEYTNSNPDDIFMDQPEYTGQCLHLTEFSIAEAFTYIGKRSFYGEPNLIIGYGIINAKNSSPLFARLGVGDDGGYTWEDIANEEPVPMEFWKKSNPEYHAVLERIQSDAANESSDDSARSTPVTIRMNDNEVESLDQLTKLAQKSTGVPVTRSWVVRELLKTGANSFRNRFKG